jgi:hypothetical protein
VNPSPDDTALSRPPTITLTSTRLAVPGHCGGTVTLQLDAAPVRGAQELMIAFAVPKKIAVGFSPGGRVRDEPLTTTWLPVVSAAGVTETTTGAGAADAGTCASSTRAAPAAAAESAAGSQ